MKRYIKIYLALIRINFNHLLTYRLNFFTSIFGSLGWSALGVANMYIITSKVSSAYGWNKNELLLLAATYPLFVAFFYMFFARNIGVIPDIINRGELDGFIVKPIDSQFIVSALRIDFTQFIRIIAGILFILFVVNTSALHITFISLISTIFLILIGMLLVYSIWFSVITLSLWFTTLSNLKELLYFMNGILRYPTDVFLKRNNIFLGFLAFFAFGLSVPLKALFQRLQLYEAALLLLFSFGLFLFSRFFWKFALRSYTSASG